MARFSERNIEYKICVLFFSTNMSEIFLNTKRNSQRHYHKYGYSSCKVHTTLGRFHWNLNSPDRFPQILNFKKIRPIVSELFHTDRKREDGRTNREMWQNWLTIFRNFARWSVQEYHIKWRIFNYDTDRFLVSNFYHLKREINKSFAYIFLKLEGHTK